MAGDVETDIDAFIRQQKQKIAQERKDLAQEAPATERKTWDKPNAENKVTVAEEVQRAPTPEIGLLLRRNSYDARRKKLQEERRKEYNELLSKKLPSREARRLPTPKGRSLPVGGGQDAVSEKRKALQEERSREYNKMLSQSPKTSRLSSSQEEEHKGLQVGQYAEQRKKLEDERIREYNEFLDKPPAQRPESRRAEVTVAELEYLRDKLREARDRDYKLYSSLLQYIERGRGASLNSGSFNHRPDIQKGLKSSRKENLPPKPATPETFLNKIGSYEREKKRLNDERKKEYNNHLAEKSKRGEKTPARQGETLAIPGLQDKKAVEQFSPRSDMELFEEFLRKRYTKRRRRKLRSRIREESPLDIKPFSQEKVKKRNEEYNEFLRAKEKEKQNRFKSPDEKHAGQTSDPPRRQQSQQYYGTLPGLMYSRSADERERKRERNLEYREVVRVMNMSDDESEEPDVKPYSRPAELNDDVNWLRDGPPGAPRKGWSTPTYEEILQKKQQEENRYRRYDDPELTRPGEQTYGRGGAAQPRHEGEKSLLEDDDWLKPQQMKNDLYNALNNMRDSLAHVVDDSPSDPGVEPQQQTQVQTSPRRPLPEQDYKPYATLLIDPKKVPGHEETSSAKRRKKDAYRQELELQIQEHRDQRKWERHQESRVNATGFLDPEKHPERLRNLPSNPERPPQNHSRGPVHTEQHGSPVRNAGLPPQGLTDPYLSGLDELSLRTDAMLSRPSDLSYPRGGGGILEKGWEGLYERPRPTIRGQPPAGYENSSYLNSVPSAYSAVNEAYHLYGMRNPLETYNDAPTVPYDTLPPSGKPKYDEPAVSSRKPDGRRTGVPFPVEDDTPAKSKQKQEVLSYQAELQKQIEERKLKKQKEKEEQDRLDRKWEEENKNYNPFGRGGGGAPLKDSTGQTLANLRQLRIQNENPPSGVKQSPRAQPPTPRLVANSPPPTDQGESTYARGGHGIFGVPKTDEQKTASDRYKSELRQQIEDKRRRAEEEREKLRQEEERENRILEEQQRKIQQEYEEDLKRKQEKEEEARRRNEEIQRLAEEKKRAAEEQRKVQEEKRLQELRERQEEERRERDRERERVLADRSSSPPVPAVKSKLALEVETPPAVNESVSDLVVEQRGKSPVVPALRKKSAPSPKPQDPEVAATSDSRPPRASSADVLNQLATMRRQLQSERARVENALDRQKNDYDVSDPRLDHRPPLAPKREVEVDIFEGARNRAPVSVRRAPSENANPSNIQEFNYLKNKGSSGSRQELRQSFPESPRTNNDLETQQLALIRKQEESLRRPPEKSDYEKALPNMAPRDLGLLRKESPQALLQSDSAFIDFNGIESLPEDFDKLPRRNVSARQRRRDRDTSPPRYNSDNISLKTNPMGSNVSLDADRISKKNEERLKRLKQMTGDDVSLADPDDVLDRFMARQRHNRPPSGLTLDDDSWMRPGSK